MKNNSYIIGIDLAWGSRVEKYNHIRKLKNDGVCIVSANKNKYEFLKISYPNGNTELIETLKPYIDNSKQVLVLIDAPVVCPNSKGARPVDRLTHSLFHSEHAACHPANSTKCSRPLNIVKLLKNMGLRIGYNIQKDSHLIIEVYPHPAMVRLFKLKKIFKYKKGLIEEKKLEFINYQNAFKKFLNENLPELKINQEINELLKKSWTKENEDLLDAVFCATLGVWHHKYRGKKSEVIGNLKTGFILLPLDLREIN